jgi:ABC-type amino acid transport system permease subunit
MGYNFNFRDIWAQTDFIVGGVIVTLWLSAVTMVTGLIIGMAGAAALVYGPRWLRVLTAPMSRSSATRR